MTNDARLRAAREKYAREFKAAVWKRIEQYHEEKMARPPLEATAPPPPELVAACRPAKRRRTFVTPAMVAEVRSRVAAGETREAVADSMGLSRSAVTVYSTGITTHLGNASAKTLELRRQRDEKILELAAQGRTVMEIIKLVDVSDRTARAVVLSHRAQHRPTQLGFDLGAAHG